MIQRLFILGRRSLAHARGAAFCMPFALPILAYNVRLFGRGLQVLPPFLTQGEALQLALDQPARVLP